MYKSSCCKDFTYEDGHETFCGACHEVCETDYSIPCKGNDCESEDAQLRHDAYGIPTGHYCESCYENNYPYRKDRYPTIEHHGYGERLSEDY